MQKHDVLEHFGSITVIAKAIGISHAAVSKWGETIPKGRAYQLTRGQLKANPAAPSARPAQ